MRGTPIFILIIISSFFAGCSLMGADAGKSDKESVEHSTDISGGIGDGATLMIQKIPESCCREKRIKSSGQMRSRSKGIGRRHLGGG